jgi:MtN3 and saliva related transmembrane protein
MEYDLSSFRSSLSIKFIEQCPSTDDHSSNVTVQSSTIDILGYAAATLTTVSFIPQAMKTLGTGDTRGISLSMYTFFTSGIALWLAYGLLNHNGPLIASNAVTVVLAGLILQRKWEDHSSARSDQEKALPKGKR